MTTNEDYTRRALAAWFRSGETAQPSAGSYVYEAAGRRYVELWNVNGTLAVYRIYSNGQLKRLKRWPEPEDASYDRSRAEQQRMSLQERIEAERDSMDMARAMIEDAQGIIAWCEARLSELPEAANGF